MNNKTLWINQKQEDHVIYKCVGLLFDRQDVLRIVKENSPAVLAIEYNVSEKTAYKWCNLKGVPEEAFKDPESCGKLMVRVALFRLYNSVYIQNYTFREMAKSLKVTARTLHFYNDMLLAGKFTRETGGRIYYEGERVRKTAV